MNRTAGKLSSKALSFLRKRSCLVQSIESPSQSTIKVSGFSSDVLEFSSPGLEILGDIYLSRLLV
jgi:hypothetical protein